MGQRDARRPVRRELSQRGQRLVEVEVRGRGRRPQHAAVGQLHTHRIAGEEHPAHGVVQADVVLGVSGRVDRDEGAPGLDRNLLPVRQHVQALRRRGVDATVERVEQRSVDARGGVDQARGIGQVTRPLLVHVDRGGGEGPGHVADAARMVEVDVGDRHSGQLRGTDPDLAQRGEQHRHRALAAGLDQHRCRTLYEVARGNPLPASEHGVDLEHAGRDAAGGRDGRDGISGLGVVLVQSRVYVAVHLPAVRVRPAHRRLPAWRRRARRPRRFIRCASGIDMV